MATQVALGELSKILQQMELNRREDRTHHERVLQAHIQMQLQQIKQMQQQFQKQIEAREIEHCRRQPSQKKETPKIPKFYGECDPKIYLD